MMYFLKVERKHDSVTLVEVNAKWAEQHTAQRWRDSEMVCDCGPRCKEGRTMYQLGGGEGVWWCQIVDPDVKRAGWHTLWRQRGSGMVSDCGPRCEESRMTYQLRGGEGVGWCQIVDLDAKRPGRCTLWRWCYGLGTFYALGTILLLIVCMSPFTFKSHSLVSCALVSYDSTRSSWPGIMSVTECDHLCWSWLREWDWLLFTYWWLILTHDGLLD